VQVVLSLRHGGQVVSQVLTLVVNTEEGEGGSGEKIDS
jgi:hypothetical protein